MGRPGHQEVVGWKRVGDGLVKVGLECSLGFVGDRRGRGFFLGRWDVRGHACRLALLGGSDGGAHLGEHLRRRIGRGWARPGRRGVGRLGRRNRTGSEELSLRAGLRVGGLAEGLVPVVFVEERVVSGCQVPARLPARFLGWIALARVAVLVIRPAQSRREIAQTSGNVGNGGPRGEQDRVHQEQDHEGAGAPPGQQEDERASNEPAEDAPGRLNAGVLLEAGVPVGDVHQAGQGQRDSDPASNVMGQGRATGPRRDQLDGQGDEKERNDDREDAEEARRGMMDGISGLAGDLKPLS